MGKYYNKELVTRLQAAVKNNATTAISLDDAVRGIEALVNELEDAQFELRWKESVHQDLTAS